MERFRFTLIAICLVLLYLGGNDLLLWFNNQSPQPVTISQLEDSGAPPLVSQSPDLAQASSLRKLR